jgi:hypothetical protein
VPQFSAPALYPLSLAASLITIFFHLNRQRIIPLTIASTISWWWSEQLVDLIHSKPFLFLMAAVRTWSTEFKWATTALVSSRVTKVPRVSTDFSKGQVGGFRWQVLPPVSR